MADIPVKACGQFFLVGWGCWLDPHALNRLVPYLDGKHGLDLQRVAETLFAAHAHNLSQRFPSPELPDLTDQQLKELAAAVKTRQSSQNHADSVPKQKRRRRAAVH